MRTKTLLLSAVLGALASASVMAQVYSVNAVGYVNVTCPVGYSIIANQLNATGGNTLTNLFTQAIITAGNGANPIDGCELIKYAPGVGFAIYSMDSSQPNGFANNDARANTNTLNPGEAAYFFNNPAVSSSAVTFTFVGTVPQGTLNVTATNGYNMVASQVPQGGGLSSALGLTIDFVNGTQDGDEVLTYTGGAFHISTIDSSQVSGFQNNAAEPQVAVGQGFFYFRNPVNAATNYVWTRAFTVN